MDHERYPYYFDDRPAGIRAEHLEDGQIAARLRNLMMQHFRETEVLKQRHDVRERFVKREHVRISRIQISRQHGVE